MSGKQETSAAIIAEMRDLAEHRDWNNHARQSNRERISDIADRLEAAIKREVDKLNSAIQATVDRSDAEIDRLRREIAELKRAGNVAKLRRVCEQMLELLKAPPGFNGGGMSVELDEEQVVMWRNRFLDALAAPPRNCDVYTADELKVIFNSELVLELPIANEHEKNLVTITAMGVIDTLFATTKEGGAK